MTTTQYKKLENGPMDEIDAAVWSSDMFHNRKNIAAFRDMMARWERGLKECEQIIDEYNDDD